MGREHWVETTFTTILDISGGTQPPKKEFVYEKQDGYIQLLQIRDFGYRELPTFIKDTPQLKKCEKDDILIGRYGASIGRILTGKSGAYNVAIAKVLIPSLVNRRYIYYYLNSHIFQEPINATERSAQTGFNKEDLERILLPVPSLNEQNHIVEKLDSILPRVQSAKLKLEKIPVMLKKFRQSVLAAACSGKLTEDWRDKQGANLKSGYNLLIDAQNYIQKEKIKIKKGATDQLENHFDLPSTWALTHMSDISYKIVDGVHKKPNYTETGIPFIQVRNLTAGTEIDYIDVKYVSKEDHEEFYKRANPQKGDILITKDGTLGITRVIKTDIAFSIFVSVALVKPFKQIILPEYLCHFINSPFGVLASKNIGTGTGLQHLHLEDLRSLVIPVPSIEEQQEIVHRVEKLFDLSDSLEAKYKKAMLRVEKIEQAVLAKAFRGELVEPDSDDEPAEELLKRIIEEKAKIEGVKTKSGMKKTARKKS